ncbi:MAG: hypothetical protein ACJAWS_003133 [Oleiphilaceae bacterium]|jgi:hypothetical protein
MLENYWRQGCVARLQIKVAVAGGDGDDPYDVISQDSGNSYLLFSFNLQAL